MREVAQIPLTLLVVPAYHGECSAQPEFEQAMTAQLAAGHELALHGYFHLDPQVPSDVIDWFRRRIYTAGEGEFCGLSEEEARERLTLGARWFAAKGWPLAGFVAPAWLLGPGAWKALRTRRRSAIHQHADKTDRVTGGTCDSRAVLDLQRSQRMAPAHINRLEYCVVAHHAQLAGSATRIASQRRRVALR